MRHKSDVAHVQAIVGPNLGAKIEYCMCATAWYASKHACGIKTIGLATHPKNRNFCDDIGSADYVMVNEVHPEYLATKTL